MKQGFRSSFSLIANYDWWKVPLVREFKSGLDKENYFSVCLNMCLAFICMYMCVCVREREGGIKNSSLGSWGHEIRACVGFKWQRKLSGSAWNGVSTISY